MRRSIVFLILVFLSAASPYRAYGLDETAAAAQYNEAIQRYQERDYTGSLALYEELMHAEIDHPDVYYNASNAAYRAGHLGKAILYIERAIRLNPADKDARANRAFLNSMKADREQTEVNAVIVFMNGIYDSFDMHRTALLSVTSWVLALLFGAGSLFVIRWKRGMLAGMAGCAMVVWIFATGTLFQKTTRLTSVQEAVIMQTEVPSYSGPGTENTRIFTAHEGTMVVIERTEGSWALIRLKSGAGGWIERDSIELI